MSGEALCAQVGWQQQASRFADPARANALAQAPGPQQQQALQGLLHQQPSPATHPAGFGPPQGGAYEVVGGGMENAAIPPGYALVPPNLLVPLSSLQTSIAAAQQPMQVCAFS